MTPYHIASISHRLLLKESSRSNTIAIETNDRYRLDRVSKGSRDERRKDMKSAIDEYVQLKLERQKLVENRYMRNWNQKTNKETNECFDEDDEDDDNEL